MEKEQTQLVDTLVSNFQIRLKNAGDWICAEQWTCRDRRFGFDSIGYIKEGSVCVCVNGAEQVVEQGGLYYLPMMQLYGHHTLTPTARVLWTHFSLSAADRAVAAQLRFPLSVRAEQPEQIEKMFSTMLEAMDGGQPGWPLRAGAMMQLLFSEFLRLSAPQLAICPQSKASEMEQIAQYIQNNLHRSPTVDQLAEQAGLAPSYFIREFKRLFRESPIQYMLNQKMQAAGNYLENSSLSIKEISLRLGFVNQNYFSAFFRKHAGFTPSEYRLMHSHLAQQAPGGSRH